MHGGNYTEAFNKKPLLPLTEEPDELLDDEILKQLDAFADILVELVLQEIQNDDK